MDIYTRDDTYGDYGEIRVVGGDVRIVDRSEGVIEIEVVDPATGHTALRAKVVATLGQPVLEKVED